MDPVRVQALQLADKADKTLGYDSKVIDEVGAGPEANFSGMQKYYAQKDASFFDPYEDYVDKATLHGGQFSVEELNSIRAENQSNWSQAGNAVARAAVNIIPQTISGFASMVDIPGYFDAEEAANNSIVNWAMDLKQEVDEDWFPIYEEQPGKSMNMSDPAWWFSRGSGLLESVGSFYLQGYGIGKLVPTVVGGLAKATKGKDLARAVMGADKSKRLLGATNTLATATMLNQSEAVIGATQVFRDVYQENLDKGLDFAEAKQRASEAAATTMNLNRVNILLNLTSAAQFLKPMQLSRQLLTAPSMMSSLGKIALETGQESIEELNNLIAEKSGRAVGSGKEKRTNVLDDLRIGMNHIKDVKSMEGLEAAFLGAIGGMGQTGVTTAMQYNKRGPGSTVDAEGNKISYMEDQANKYKAQQEVINELKDKGVNTTDILQSFNDAVVLNEKIIEAVQNNDQEAYDALKDQMFENQVYKAASTGTMEVLENLYKAEAAKNPDEVGQEYINNAKKALGDLKVLEDVYNNAEDYVNTNEIYYNRANKMRAERNLGFLEEGQKRNNLELAQRVREIAKQYEYETEREIVVRKEGEVERVDKVTDKSPLTYSMSNLSENTGKTEAQRKTYDKFLKEVQKLDSFKKEEGYIDAIDRMSKILLNNDKEFAEITSPEYQKKAAEKQAKQAEVKAAYKDLDGATSIAQVKNLMDTIEDPDFKKAAEKKLEDLEKQKNIQQKQKKVELEVAKFSDRIKNATEEELATLQEEINNAEISQTKKQELLDKINTRAKILNGEEVSFEEAEELENPLEAFSSVDPAELESQVTADEKNFATEIPVDLPNPNTESEDVNTEVEDAAENLLSNDKTMVIGVDEQGNLIYDYMRAQEAFNRGAFLSREFNQTETLGVVDREEFTDTVEDNLKLLDPDFLTEGTDLVMEVDNDYVGEKYDPTSTTREKISWPVRLAEIVKKYENSGIDYRQSPEYIAEVPIKVSTKDGDKVFYIHDNAWYREENLSGTQEEIAEDRRKNFEIRKSIIEKRKVKSKVNYKSFGKLFKTFDGKKVSIDEAMPDPNLILGVGRNGVIELPGEVETVLNGGKLLKTDPEDGRLYAVVKVGPSDYLPIPLQRKAISEEVKKSIVLAIEAHLTNDPENPVVKAIADSSLGYDITTTKGLADYLNQFIYLYSTEGSQGLDSVLIQGGGPKSTLKSNMPLFAVTPTGIQFGKPGVQMGTYADAKGNKVVQYAINISQNFEKTPSGAKRNASAIIDKLVPLLESGNVLTNANRKSLALDADAVLILDKDGNTRTDKYSNFIKSGYESNILSINIGSDENPKWVYTIQPTIVFDTKFANIDGTTKKTAARPVRKAPKQTPVATEEKLYYKGANPAVDVIVTAGDKVLLVKRKEGATEGGKWAIPGGFVDTDAKLGEEWKPGKETGAITAAREIKEETGLDLNNATLEQREVLDDRSRDPRNSEDSWIETTVYTTTVPVDQIDNIKGADDASEARWFTIEELSQMPASDFAFDHSAILERNNLKPPFTGAILKGTPISIEKNTASEIVKSTENLLTLLNVPTAGAVADSSVDNGTVIFEDPKVGIAASFGLVPSRPTVETAPVSEDSFVDKLLNVVGIMPSAARNARAQNTAEEISKELKLDEIEKVLKETGSVEETIKRFTVSRFTESNQEGFEFLAPEQMAFIINSAVEMGIPVPNIASLFSNIVDTVEKEALQYTDYSKALQEVEDQLKGIYAAFDSLQASEEQLLDMGYPPLKDSYTLKELQGFAKKALADMEKSNPENFKLYKSNKFGSNSDEYRLYKAYQLILDDSKIDNYKKQYDLLEKSYEQLKSEGGAIFNKVEEEFQKQKLETKREDTGNLLGTSNVEEQIEGRIAPQDTTTLLAEDLLAKTGFNASNLEASILSLETEEFSQEALNQSGFTSQEEALAVFRKALEIFNQRAKDSDSVRLPNGDIFTIDGNDQDIGDSSDDSFDDFLLRPVELTPEQIAAQKKEIDEMIIKGLNPASQHSLIAYLSADIINKALSAKEVDGKQTVAVGPILDNHFESFKAISALFKKRGLVNRAKHVDAILDQYAKVRKLVNQNMSKFTTGTVEDLELDDNVESVGLERGYSDEWSFTVSSKNTASADLKKFFSSIVDQDENGPINNPLGFKEIVPFDVVYDTLHELLANKPADYSTMIEILELHTQKFPWLKSVIEKIENAPEKIQNEFVSDMTKHHVDMQFIMWSKDPNGNYSLQTWSANASSIENRLRAIWQSNLKGLSTQSNLVYIDEDNNYKFNPEVAKVLTEQAEEFAQDPASVTNQELATWLGNFGIVLNDETYNDLRKGKYSNKGRKTWDQLFKNSYGIVKVLTKELNKKINLQENTSESVDVAAESPINNLLADTAVKALAKLDALNSLNTFSNSFQAGGKTVYSYGNNNFLINRMRDITAYNAETGEFVNQRLIEDLKAVSFTGSSIWLDELTNKGEVGELTRRNLKVGYISLEALKKLFTPSQDNRKLNNLTAAEHEVSKIGFFQNASGEIIDKEQRRTVDFFYPTMSDKTTMLTIKALAREFKFDSEGKISRKNLEMLYDAIVLPELNRMRSKQSNNIKGYEPNYFYFFPTLNTLPVEVNGVTRTYRDIVLDKDDLVYDQQVKDAVLENLEEVFDKLLDQKVQDWNDLGIGKTIKDSKGKVVDNYSFLDKSYMESVAKGSKGEARVRYAAADYVFNYLVANAESYKLFAGDPALYAKFSNSRTLEENLNETFINIGKRLAGDIAPGMELANSMNNKYYQVFLADKEIASNNVKDKTQREFFEKISSTYAKDYGKIEGSDAQEYTTWQEHLYVMKQLGRLTKAQYETFKRKLTAQSEGNFNKTNLLTYQELGIIMQPLKPVYVGNITSREDNADRRVYIKSSSFPLIPEFTSGLQMDKIRQALEKFEKEIGSKETSDGVPAFVRASFGTANKVGAVKNSLEVFDDNGNVKDNLTVSEDNSLLLSRSNFRIQQDVPYKREKDSVNVGTQEAKLLFVNLMDTKVTDDKTGEDLFREYNNTYQDLFVYNQKKLAKSLGLVETTLVTPDLASVAITPTTAIVSEVSEKQEAINKETPIKKAMAQQKLAEEVGEETLARVNFINRNFDKIVAAINDSNLDLFFDENNQFKKCE